MVINFYKICVFYAFLIEFSLLRDNPDYFTHKNKDLKVKCNIIGAGRLGKNIALALSTAQIISSLFIYNRSKESAHLACQEIGSGTAVDKIEQLPAADVTWICTNDDSIHLIIDALMNHSTLQHNSLVIHCSGVLNSTLLNPLKTRGCSVASFHPLKAFKTNYLAPDAFNNVDCVLEGDPVAIAWLKQTFSLLGAQLTAIKPEAKTIYHAAACMASNYLITLASCSEELLHQAGISPQQSRRMLVNLMQGNLTNLHQTEHIAESLTGPIARGDTQTLALHLDAIENKEIQHLYKAAGLATAPLTQLNEDKKLEINALFQYLTRGC